MRRCLKKSGFTVIELLVVTGIFTLIVGVSFTLLSTGRVSMFVNEAQIQAEENARLAMNRISKELHLSRASLVHFSDGTADWATNNTSGNAVKLQIPVGSYDGRLNLTGTNELKWGNEDTEGAYIAYLLTDSSRLIRSTYTADWSAVTSTRVIANDITSLAFSRSALDSSLINIELTTQGEANTRTAARTLRSSIKLRN